MRCHGTNTPAAQFDIRPYTAMPAVVADLSRWRRVSEKLAAEQMPPKVAPQPPSDLRQKVVDWIQTLGKDEARKHEGDPGPVLARRLSNAEYNNTIRDLTGIDMKPAREFPVDPANIEGFDNSGESLVMSPALFDKYLKAARQVSEHLVLKPDGFDFAEHSMLAATDRDQYSVQRILDFYARQPTDYAAYFEAAWRYKHRAVLGKPKATLAETAAESRLSARYLSLVWKILEEPSQAGKPEVGPVAKLQAMWRALPAPGSDGTGLLFAKCIVMRDFVQGIRSHTAMQFAAPRVRGLPPASQPLLNWKLRQFNSHRRESDRNALRNDTDPEPAEPVIPRYADLHQEAAPRWAALMAQARAGDADLVVPAAERSRYEASFARLASVFPDVFYVKERGRYFPDDSQDKGRFLSAGYHNVMGFWRDDLPLMELILDEKGQRELNRLWEEFDFIADHTFRTWEQFYFNQSGAVYSKDPETGWPRPAEGRIDTPAVIFEIRDAYLAKAAADPQNDPIAAEAIRDHFQGTNDILRHVQKLRVDAEPSHLQSLVRFAERAWRRPLSQGERDDLVAYYHTVREKNGLSHEDAMRDMIVSVLVSPKFCYRLDLDDATKDATKPQPGARPGGLRYTSLSGFALANRLSYFLWASMPDDELLADAGKLQNKDVLIAQTERMLKDPRSRGLAVEFGGNWLDFRRFEQHNAVDRQRFPSFTDELREAMFEEPVRLIENTIRGDGSVLDWIYANYSFVNPVLAKHYGIPDVTGDSNHWVRVDDANRYGRGGLLPMAVFLTQNAPGLRTSPVKRGYWVVHRLLGETIPPPPPTVPELPKDEAAMDLPLREVLAQHRSNAACASCHARFDSFGLAFEDYGPVGERREKDLAGRPVENQAVLPGGIDARGLQGVQEYIHQRREKDYIDNLSRKLLSYGLSRSLVFSDEILVERMRSRLTANGNRFSSLVESIVTSSQFVNRRNPDTKQAAKR
jgi:hypothetical protein